jgi:clostripain
VVTITPDPGYAFYKWAGDCPESNRFRKTVTLVMDSDKELTASMGELLPNWLVMVYMDGANNLEGEAIQDINMLEQGLYDLDPQERAGVEIVVLLDRISGDLIEAGSTYDDTSNGDWTGTRLFSVVPDNNSTEIASAPLAGWWRSTETELSMGDVRILKSFIEWAHHAYYQYGKHALILWNHGGGARALTPDLERLFSDGTKAICVDEEVASPYDIQYQLYLGEVQEALLPYYSSSQKLDFLGLDACLMGTVEVAYEFRELVKYMSFSPGLEWGSWDYRAIINGLHAETTAAELAQRVVTTYRDKSVRVGAAAYNTQTAIDLSGMEALKTELDGLAAAIDADVEAGGSTVKSTVENLRDQSLHYYDDRLEDESIAWPYFEIGDFCGNLIQGGIAADQAGRVVTALQDTVVYAWAGSTNGDYEGPDIGRGVSVFFSRGDKIVSDSGSRSQYHYQWWYTAEDTAQWWIAGGETPSYYGHIDFCNSDDNGKVESWRELFEKWYDTDAGSPATPGGY